MFKKYIILIILVISCLLIVKKYSIYIKPLVIELLYRVTPSKEFKDEKELVFNFAFKDKMISETILPEVKTLSDFHKMFEKLRCSDVRLDSVYDFIIINSEQRLKGNIIKITYTIRGQKFETYSYNHRNAKFKKNATFIIPESGKDMSWKMENNIWVTGYKFDELLAKYSDNYIFIKPNEAPIAFSANGFQLNYEFIYGKLLNEGKSYSKLYIQHCIAFVKYLKTKHQTVSTFGLSQGGYANVLISEFSNPTYAWICAGYSTMFDNYYWASSFNQILGNNIKEFSESKYFKRRIQNSNTIYYFSYGKNDGDFYNFEYKKHYTGNFFKGLKNINIIYFNGSHTFPVVEIEKFMKTNYKN